MERSRQKRLAIRRSRAFRETNDAWNDFNYNHGFSIGLMVNVVGDNLFDTFEAFEAHYFETGRIRQEIIKSKPIPLQKDLLDLRAVYPQPNMHAHGLSSSEIAINLNHGRTLEELKELAHAFYHTLQEIGHHDILSIKELETFVYIRTIDETYIGHQREVNTIRTLQQMYPRLFFRKTRADIDRRYAIDVEVLDNRLQLIGGFQIKSDHFAKGKSEAMKKAQNYNSKKHITYTKRFGVPAAFLCSSTDGRISNHEALGMLNF